MSEYNEEYTRFFFEKPLIPQLPPIFGADKMLEQDEDYQYLRYMYPQITRHLLSCIEDECDRMEYEGSPMFDAYPDRTSFQLMAKKITKQCIEKDPDRFPADKSLLENLVEVLLYHEILYRRNRYRNRRRLYF